jgi:hypothetical protein
MTPEFDSEAAHGAYAPLHWNAEEWDFRAWLEDDESLTDGKDLQFLLDGELEEEDDKSSDGYDSSSEDAEMTALPVMTALEMMAATGAAATALSVQVLWSSVVGS